jgi:dihydroorotase
MIGLQTFLPGLVALEKELGWPLLIKKITEGPSKVFGLENKFDSLTIFDPNETWTYDGKSNLSLSANSPWMGKTLKGKIKLVINKQKLAKY